MSILVVEDDHIVQRIIKKTLERNGYDVLLSDSVKEAVNLMKTNSTIELIISDIMMPEADGFDLLRIRQSFKKFRRIPILMCTSLGDKDPVAKSLSFDANDYLIKPFKAEMLMGMVKKLLDKAWTTILIVDDDKGIIDSLDTMLSDSYNIVSAGTGEDALDLIQEQAVDLILLDIEN